MLAGPREAGCWLAAPLRDVRARGTISSCHYQCPARSCPPSPTPAQPGARERACRGAELRRKLEISLQIGLELGVGAGEGRAGKR